MSSQIMKYYVESYSSKIEIGQVQIDSKSSQVNLSSS